MEKIGIEEKEIIPSENLDFVIADLLKEKERGHRAFCKFNGHILHSDNISVDSAYLEVTGYTRDEIKQKERELLEEFIKEENAKEEKAIEKIPYWIERGKALIFPERHAKWEKEVEKRATQFYHGLDIEYSLEVMEALEKGMEISEVLKLLNNHEYGYVSLDLVKNIVYNYSSRGPEFLENVFRGQIGEDAREILEAKKEENRVLAEANASKDYKLL